MATGSVGIVQLNNAQGAFKQCERTFLYIGTAAAGAQEGVIPIGSASDLDALLGSGESNLKTQLAAARLNAQDTGFFAYAVALGASETWNSVALAVLEKPDDLDVEAIVVCDPVSSAAAVTAAQTAANSILSSFAKFVTVHLCCTGVQEDETWSAYATRIKAYIADLVADRVSITPLLHGNDLGAVCGRLCNPAASVADTPMRVATGALAGLGEPAADSAAAPLTMPVLKDLADSRFSVPQWYPGYDGKYWADMPLLDAEGGDYQVVEYRRIIDYIARRVRIRAIQRIGDRRLNNTPLSISQNQTYFAGPVRDAARTVTIAGTEYPGMIEIPDSDCVSIKWISTAEVAIAITCKPFHCPKKITCYLGLDLSNE